MTIRKVEPADARAIADIYNHYVLDTTATFEEQPVGEPEMRARIEACSRAYPYLVCADQGQIIGYCYAHPWKSKSAYARTLETTVYLRPEHTRRGIGEMLMLSLIDECRAAGVHVLVACITAENVDSIRFHRRLGFVPVSHFKEVGCKFGRYLDVVDLQLTLC